MRCRSAASPVARFSEGQLRDSDVIAPESLPELERGPLALGKSFVDVGADDRGLLKPSGAWWVVLTKDALHNLKVL